MSTATGNETRSPKRRLGDLVFANLTIGAAVLILIALAGVALFLTLQGIPGFAAGPSNLKGHANIWGYVWPLLFGTLLAAVIALMIAVPLAIGVALAISHYAPKRLAVLIGYLVDLLAAVPSVVYGLWGIIFLSPRLQPIYVWLSHHLGFLPFFKAPVSSTGRTILTAGIVLAIMVLPIVISISREVFAQTPRLHEEAALALGATRWEMIRLAVFPYSKSGVVSASMLGLGRALGETMAVAMVLSATGVITWNLISSTNPSTIAANIALSFAEATGKGQNALIFTGLVLFALTFGVNFLARAIISRSEAKTK